MNSDAEPVKVEIDQDGDMQIETFEYANNRVHTITLITVSSKVLSENSDFFRAHIKQFGIDEPLRLHHASLPTLEFWLQILHRCVNEERVPDMSMADFERAITLGQEYEFNFSKLAVWFAIWLGSQDVRSFEADDLRRLLSISSVLNHDKASEILNIHLSEVESRHEDPHIAPAFKLFPPVPMMSTRQESIIMFLLEDVYKGDYERWGFSPSFQAIYGDPTEYYSDFQRLMTTSFDHRVLPRIKRLSSLADEDTKPRFLWFCQMVDDVARNKDLPMLKRREMEAAWVWVAFELYEKDEAADPALLKKIVARRVHPRLKVEQYWADKCAQLCWTHHDIAYLEDGCEEDPETERIVDGDENLEMEMDSAGMETPVQHLVIRTKAD